MQNTHTYIHTNKNTYICTDRIFLTRSVGIYSRDCLVETGNTEISTCLSKTKFSEAIVPLVTVTSKV